MITSPAKEDITAVVLAGGQGRRVDEQDKGLLEYAGRRMVEYALDSLSKQTQDILIVANRNIEAYESYGYPVVSDRIKGFLGPLAGIDAAFSVTGSSYLLCVPCDSPFIPDDLMQRFIDAATGNNPIIVASDSQRLHPVISLVHRSVWPDIEKRLNERQLRLMNWIEAAGYDVADFSANPGTLKNLNTFEQLKNE